MTQHIVVHAGFHKTGTTAIQSFFQGNGPHLWPHMALVLPARIKDILKVATLHATLGDPISLTEFQTRLAAFLRTLDIGKKRHLLISAEDLAGLIPGRDGMEDYAACPALLAAIRDTIRDVFGTDKTLTFYLSTRAPDAWLRSAYWQNLRVGGLTIDRDAFVERFAAAADFAPILTATQDALGDTPLVTCPLEDTTGLRFGAASPVVDLFPLSPDVLSRLAPIKTRNAAPSDALMAQVLDLNRRRLGPDDHAERLRRLLPRTP